MTLFMKRKLSNENKVFILSIFVGLFWMILEYLNYKFFNKKLSFSPTKIEYNFFSTFFYSSKIIISLIGCTLPFIIEKRREIFKYPLILILFLLTANTLTEVYIYNDAIDNPSNRHYVIGLLLLLQAHYIASILYAINYKKSVLLALTSTFVVQNIILPIIYFFSFSIFTYFITNGGLLVAFLSWPLVWSTLFLITNKFSKISDVINYFWNVIFKISPLTLKEYRNIFAITHLSLIIASIAAINLLHWLPNDIHYLFLINLIICSIVIIFLLIISFISLYNRLLYLKMTNLYIYRFIPILNLKLIYLTLIKTDIDNNVP